MEDKNKSFAVKIDFNAMVVCRNALKIHKAIMEATHSAYECEHSKEYNEVAKCLDFFNSKL